MSTPWSMTRTFPDIDHTVRMRPYMDHSVEFVVYGVIGVTEKDEVLWQLDGSANPLDLADGLDNAEWYLRGKLKFDGCVNYELNQQDFLHECGPAPFENHAMLWRWIYFMAHEMLPAHNWCDELVLPTGRVIEHSEGGANE